MTCSLLMCYLKKAVGKSPNKIKIFYVREMETYCLAYNWVAGQSDASSKYCRRHCDVETSVQEGVPALPRDSDGANGKKNIC